jgi:excisionase family DNA binding protein
MNYSGENGTTSKTLEVPIWCKSNLTIKEAAVYSNIGEHTLKELCESGNSCFSFLVGKKRLINRELFDEYIKRSCREGF